MTAGRVASLDLGAEFIEVREGVEAAARRVLESGRYIGGPEVEGLEREFAAYCGTAHGVAVSSGTDALRFALIAAGVGPGHEVITSPFTFIGSTEAISQAGARSVFADIEPATFTLDPARVQAALTPRTRALMPVHLYGQAADMEGLRSIARDRGLAIVEDACQAHGAALGGRRCGALGSAGCFSFYPTKNLGAAGEAGLVTTDDAALADHVRRLRDHGQSGKYVHAEEGYNGRLDAIQAAILRVKLKRLEAWNDRRRAIAARYRAGLAAAEKQGLLILPAERTGARHVYHLFAVRVPGGGAVTRRDRVRGALLEAGIETGVHYPVPLHRQPCYASMGKGEGSFPESERASREVLTLPLYPQLRDEQVDQVALTLSRILAAR
ncbi:MAG TPA: DegT/DnrJ/EryC1/StrS family aminotransferase [Patescibacteria group bacterium]|nr:DegT/DnrJ/EryC1/StrS family aminotransferase [Patescibacteria group bacterium]